MVKIRLRRSILVGGVVLSFFLLNSFPVSAGWGQVLTDAELDAIYAQGLSIVDISFGFSNIAGRFDFSSRTTIKFPEIPSPNSVARIDFLGGLFSILADPPAPSSQAFSNNNSDNGGPNPPSNQASNQGSSGLILPPIRATLSNPGEGGSNPPGTETATSPPAVTVTFGDGPGISTGGSILSITASGVDVNSVVNILIGLDTIGNRGSAYGVIRRALGAL